LILGEDLGAPPPVDLTAERKHGEFVRGLISSGLVTCCHDVSDGGLYVAAAEMAIAGDVGVDLKLADDAATLFGEDQARYLIAVADADAIIAAAKDAEIIATRIGRTTANSPATLTRRGANAISVDELRAAQQQWLPTYMSEVED
jgi:phosphoribosylformylglycinamidine synthase